MHGMQIQVHTMCVMMLPVAYTQVQMFVILYISVPALLFYVCWIRGTEQLNKDYCVDYVEVWGIRAGNRLYRAVMLAVAMSGCYCCLKHLSCCPLIYCTV